MKRCLWALLAAMCLLAGCAGETPEPTLSGAAAAQAQAGSVLYLEVLDEEDAVFGSGSGFVVGDGTLLVTNYHVIADARRLNVYSADGTVCAPVKWIAAYDEDLDLAVLELPEDISAEPVSLGDSAAVQQGDAVYAVGYPLGLTNSISDGIVSSFYRGGEVGEVFLISAPISPGSSGGALFNDAGEVVGVTTGSFVNGQNVNVAIPSAQVEALLERQSEAEYLAMHYVMGHSVYGKLQAFLTNQGHYIETAEDMVYYYYLQGKEVGLGQYFDVSCQVNSGSRQEGVYIELRQEAGAGVWDCCSIYLYPDMRDYRVIADRTRDGVVIASYMSDRRESFTLQGGALPFVPSMDDVVTVDQTVSADEFSMTVARMAQYALGCLADWMEQEDVGCRMADFRVSPKMLTMAERLEM